MSKETELEFKNPWRTMLFQPRLTLRRLLEKQAGYGLIALIVIQGIAITFQQISNPELMRLISFPSFVVAAVLTGPLWGFVAVWCGSYIMRWTGRLFGGAATVEELRMALAWSSLPSVFQLFAVFGVLLRYGPNGAAQEALLALQSGLLGIGVGLWQLVLLLACLMEVQRYPLWKALGNIVIFTLTLFMAILLPLLLIALPLLS